jgi:hypothetical protein
MEVSFSLMELVNNPVITRSQIHKLLREIDHGNNAIAKANESQ